MEAIILAGGLGTRLRPAVPQLPKPLAPVAGRPFLEWILEDLAASGFTLVVLCVGYRHDVIEAVVGTTFAGLTVRYAIELQPLGTGGAARLGARKCSERNVFVLNGDTFAAVDYQSMLATHRAAGSRLTVAAAEVPDTARFGEVLTEGDRIVGFAEKSAIGAGRINAGVYVMDRLLLETLELPPAFSFEQEILRKRLKEVRPMAYAMHGTFIDIGVPEDYARAQTLFRRR